MILEELEKFRTLDADALINLLNSPDEGVRRWAARELGNRREARAVDALIDLLQDNETVWSAAQDAAWALAEIGDRRAVDPLIAMIEKICCWTCN